MRNERKVNGKKAYYILKARLSSRNITNFLLSQWTLNQKRFEHVTTQLKEIVNQKSIAL